MYITMIAINLLVELPMLVLGNNCEDLICSPGKYCCAYLFSYTCTSNPHSYSSCTYIPGLTDAVFRLSVSAIVGISVGAFVLCVGGIAACVFCCAASNRSNSSGRVVAASPTTMVQTAGYHVQSSSYPQPFSVSSQPTKSISAQVPYANLSGYYQPGAAPPSYSTALNQPATA